LILSYGAARPRSVWQVPFVHLCVSSQSFAHSPPLPLRLRQTMSASQSELAMHASPSTPPPLGRQPKPTTTGSVSGFAGGVMSTKRSAQTPLPQVPVLNGSHVGRQKPSGGSRSSSCEQIVLAPQSLVEAQNLRQLRGPACGVALASKSPLPVPEQKKPFAQSSSPTIGLFEASSLRVQTSPSFFVPSARHAVRTS